MINGRFAHRPANALGCITGSGYLQKMPTPFHGRFHPIRLIVLNWEEKIGNNLEMEGG